VTLSDPSVVTAPASTGLRRRVIVLLALACGGSVANVYFPQAISPLVGRGLHVSPGSAALAVTATQLGYAAGIFLLVPLGDRVPHRRLVVILLLLTGLGLVTAGLAPGLPLLVAAGAAVGATTVVPQILLPMASGLVGADRRAAVTGTLLSGLLAGILLARTFSGLLGLWLGWRAPYLVAAVLAIGFAVALGFAIPATEPATRARYLSLLAAAVRLLRTEPALRRSCFYQATMFGGFTAAWTSLALLVAGPRYQLGTGTVGLIALVGAASALVAPAAGRRIDRTGPGRINLVCFLAAAAAAAVLLAGTAGGPVGLAALTIGMLLLDVAVQCGQLANQARIFALAPQIRSRLNTAYMTCAFLGGTAGSWLGVRGYTYAGWPGVCALVATLALLPLALPLAWHLRRR
jgi:predicted MFS family arabinose efflux permease